MKIVRTSGNLIFVFIIFFASPIMGQQITVDGGILISDSDSTKAGIVRWTGSDFEGYDGINWISLTDTGSVELITDSLYVYSIDTVYYILKDSMPLVVDTDGDTYIHTETGIDNDQVHVFIDGDAFMTFKKNANDNHTIHLEQGAGRNLYMGYLSGNASNTSTLGRNTALGHYALRANTTGIQNVAIGYNAMKENSTGGQNVVLGEDALRDGSDNNNNIVLGVNSYLKADNAARNVLIGSYIGSQDSTGTDNVFVGYSTATTSGISPENRKQNVILGSYAGNGEMGDGNVFIGYQAGQHADVSNTLIIENSDSETPLIYGDFQNDSVRIHGHFTADHGQIGLEETGRTGKLVVSHESSHDVPTLRLMEHNTTGARIYFQDTSVTDIIGIHGSSAAGKLRVYFHDESSASAGPKFTVQADGKTAINGDSPIYTLHVFGDMMVEDAISIQPAAVPPPIFVIGTMWYDAGTNRLRVWDGALWQPCW